MKIVIDDVNYAVSPMSPGLSPFNSRICVLLQKIPEGLEEAAKNGEEIDQCVTRLLDGSVDPKPTIKGHFLQLFNAVIDCTNRVNADAQLFREQKGSST